MRGCELVIGLELYVDDSQVESDGRVEQASGEPQKRDIDRETGQERRRPQIVVADMAVEAMRREHCLERDRRRRVDPAAVLVRHDSRIARKKAADRGYDVGGKLRAR